MNDSNQKLEELIKKLNIEKNSCTICKKELKKEQMLNIYNYETDKSVYICKTCFKRKRKM
jgi:hypothetical protein